MNKKLLTMIAVVVIGVIGAALIAKTDRSAQDPQAILAPRADDHVRGDIAKAKVVVIEYSDFQCPACASAHKYFEDIETIADGQVAFIYRHFPLTAIHKNAVYAARAAEAAALQGKFFPMHDLLFAKQDEWKDVVDIAPLFADYAASLGMDRTKFLADFTSDAVAERVTRDARDARALKLSGTPSIFVDGEAARLPADVATFHAALEERVERAQR